MILLITGCAGFIGSRTTQLALDVGHKVVGIDNLNDYYDVRIKQHLLEPIWKTSAWAFDASRDDQCPAVLHYTISAPWLKRRFAPSQAIFESIAKELGVDLPQLETRLLRSCAEALAVWLLAPLRVVLHLLRAILSKASDRREKAQASQSIATHWLGYFMGGPMRVLCYWKRIREIKSPSFDPFVSGAL